jgi:hypothetical protein
LDGDKVKRSEAIKTWRWWIFPLLFLAVLPVHAQMMSNVYERVLLVRVGAETASAFTVEVDGRQYLLTAKHVVAKLAVNDFIEYDRAGKWIRLPVQIFKCDDPTDIAVLIAPYQLTTAFDFPVDTSKISYGQDVYFLGFPYGITLNGINVNGTLPMPFIKRATYSGNFPLNPDKHSVLLLLDGYSNPGFSGGPIVYKDPFLQSWDYKLLGVVSGFQPEVTDVMEKHPIRTRDDASAKAKEQPWRIGTAPDGSLFEYLETGKYVALNTGIVRGFAIFPALELIQQHPIGPKVDTKKMDFPADR